MPEPPPAIISVLPPSPPVAPRLPPLDLVGPQALPIALSDPGRSKRGLSEVENIFTSCMSVCMERSKVRYSLCGLWSQRMAVQWSQNNQMVV